MIRRALVLLALALALGAWERTLRASAADARAASGLVGRPMSAAERARLPLAALVIERSGAPREVYARVDGAWRALTYHRAVADRAALQALIDALAGTDGTVRSADGENAADYGIGTPATIRVSFAGPRALDDPSGDVRASFDVGASVPGREAAFVRRSGRPEIWCLDADPRALLEPAGELPPLVDARVTPAAWPGWEASLASVTVESQGRRVFLLERRALAPDELAATQAGGVPALWRLVTDRGEEPTANLLAHGYTLFLEHARFAAVLAGAGELDADRRAALGFDAPARRLVLGTGHAEPLELLLAAPRSDGRVAVLEPASGVAVLVDGAVAELLAPPPAWLRTDAERNHWDPYLR